MSKKVSFIAHQLSWLILTIEYEIPYIVGIFFHFSENDGEVELDDVWFAYPSRPYHLILKVNILLQA